MLTAYYSDSKDNIQWLKIAHRLRTVGDSTSQDESAENNIKVNRLHSSESCVVRWTLNAQGGVVDTGGQY